MVPFVKSRGAGFTGRSRKTKIHSRGGGRRGGRRRGRFVHGCSWLVDIFPERRKESIFYVDREKRATCPSSLAGYSRLDEQKHRLIPRDRGSREEEREERKRKREREWWRKLCYAAEFIWRKWKFVAIVASRRSRYSSDAFRWIR